MFTTKLLQRMKNAYGVTVLTGAGISAESGVPTFRGKDGLWKQYKVEELATIDAFKKNPQLFWEFYSWRRELLKDVKPNLGHYALVDFEKYFKEFIIITQNIDNLHFTAGSKKILEIHGNINRNKCSKCGIKIDKLSLNDNKVPVCEKCAAIVRPDVILYGENLDPNLLQKAQQVSSECEVFFSIGTSSLVEPAATLPFLAKANGAYLVEINSEETPLTQHADEILRGPAGKILPQLAIILEKLFAI
jgi:NAD-dependent deacetylase